MSESAVLIYVVQDKWVNKIYTKRMWNNYLMLPITFLTICRNNLITHYNDTRLQHYYIIINLLTLLLFGVYTLLDTRLPKEVWQANSYNNIYKFYFSSLFIYNFVYMTVTLENLGKKSTKEGFDLVLAVKYHLLTSFGLTSGDRTTNINTHWIFQRTIYSYLSSVTFHCFRIWE